MLSSFDTTPHQLRHEYQVTKVRGVHDKQAVPQMGTGNEQHNRCQISEIQELLIMIAGDGFDDLHGNARGKL